MKKLAVCAAATVAVALVAGCGSDDSGKDGSDREAALATTTTPSPTAADRSGGCGSGYHKQEDGRISGSRSGSRDGKRLTASISGYVRWCTRERNNNRDQFNQRVKIGIPQPVIHRASFAGTRRTKICLTSSFKVTQAGGSGVSSLTISKEPEATITISGTKSKTVTLPPVCKTGASAQSTTALQDTIENYSATAPNCGGPSTTPYVKSITFYSVATVYYRVGSEARRYTLQASNTDTHSQPLFDC